jgi:hypothetical protein
VLAIALLQQLEVRVSQAGLVARQDVVHHTLEGSAALPQPPASLIVVHGRRPIPLVPGELHLPAIGEEGVPSCGVVGILAGIHALLEGEHDVVE